MFARHRSLDRRGGVAVLDGDLLAQAGEEQDDVSEGEAAADTPERARGPGDRPGRAGAWRRRAR